MGEQTTESAKPAPSEQSMDAGFDERETAGVSNRPRQVRDQRVDDHSNLLIRFVGILMSWLVVALLLVLAIDMPSPELYFILAFHGLLGIKLVLAPTQQPPRWWRLLDGLTYVGFVVLLYIVVRNVLQYTPG
jgi:succinate dehydrogenase hydrophobic anchor subunit